MWLTRFQARVWLFFATSGPKHRELWDLSRTSVLWAFSFLVTRSSKAATDGAWFRRFTRFMISGCLLFSVWWAFYKAWKWRTCWSYCLGDLVVVAFWTLGSRQTFISFVFDIARRFLLDCWFTLIWLLANMIVCSLWWTKLSSWSSRLLWRWGALAVRW